MAGKPRSVAARQKQPKKRGFAALNEHFEAVFNALVPAQVVFSGLSAGVIWIRQRAKMPGRFAVYVVSPCPISASRRPAWVCVRPFTAMSCAAVASASITR
ncbi:hypothetical protein EQ832_09150 [Pseudomonas sp. ALS1131]|nr:hypothetical protein EQ832_09150 [Pseudomonas sp. ALS1131]